MLRRPANVAWYTGGLDNRIDSSDETGVASIVITSVGEWIVTDVIEAPRLRAEALTDASVSEAGLEVIAHPWTVGPSATIRSLVGTTSALATDLVRAAGEVDLGSSIAPLRYVLDAAAIRQYRSLGADTRSAFDEVAAVVRPEMTEREAATLLAAAARRRGLTTPVLLAGGADRIPKFRHPVPTDAPLGARVLLAASCERFGLFVSLTRFVDFEPPSAELQERIAASDEILRRMRTEATRPGRTLGQAFDDCRSFYADAGFPDEWENHHQGGMAGYRSREIIAAPGDERVIATGQAFAWNPSVRGAKSEETFVIIEEHAEVVT